MFLGGELPIVDLAKQRGLPVGYGTMWVGKWNTIAGDGTLPDVARHVAACEQRGVLPYVHLYVLAGGLKSTSDFTPLYQYATAIDKTLGGAHKAVVSIEPEWNENDVPANPAPFDQAFAKAAAILHTSTNVKVMSCPGGWDSGYGGAGGTMSRFPKMLDSLDLAGVQCMRARPRDSPESYDAAPQKTLDHLRTIRRITDKPLMVPDVALGSYGGGFSASYPWDGGDALAEVQRQKAAVDGFVARKADFEAINTLAIVWRELRDNHSRDPAHNWYGKAEWSFGLQDQNGNAKPALESYLKLASQPPAPTPPPAPGPAPAPAPADEVTRLRKFRDAVKSALDDSAAP